MKRKPQEKTIVLAPQPERAEARSTSEELLRIARVRWKLMLAIVAIAVVAAAILASVLPSKYRATAVGAVAPLTNTLTPSEAFHGVEALDRRSVVATVAALPSAAAGRRLDYDISTAVLPNTNLVRIDIDAKSPEIAASIANATLDVLNVQTTAMFKYYGVTPVTRAVAPASAVSPHRTRIVAAGFLIGLFLAVGVAYALESR